MSLENDGAIAVIDVPHHKFLRLIQLEGKGNTPKSRPMGITVHPDGSTVFVTTGSFGHLFLVDPATQYMTGNTLVMDGGLALPWWSKRGDGEF